MKNDRSTNTTVVAVLVALAAALAARSWLQVSLRDYGLDKAFAADVSYLVVPPILLLLLFPVLRQSRAWLRSSFDTRVLSARFVLRAIALGLLLRAAWWCQLVAGVALGFYSNSDPLAVVGPIFGFQCPPAHIIATGVLVMAVLVPIVEEIVHRGFVQTALSRYGPVVAVVGSAIVFTVFHPPGSWGFVMSAGLLLGTQYWVTKSLWASLITHATINGLIQLDWRCLRGQWNPRASDIPVAETAAIATIMFLACVSLIVILLARMHRGDVSPR